MQNILQYRYYILAVLIVITLSITNITSCQKAVELSEQIKVQADHPKVIYQSGKERVVNTNTETTREVIRYKDGTVVEKEKIVNRDIIKEKEVEKRVEIPVYTAQNGSESWFASIKYKVIGDSGSRVVFNTDRAIVGGLYIGIATTIYSSQNLDRIDWNRTELYIGIGIKF